MNSKTKRISNDAVPHILLEGLVLDVSILDALLKRHRCSHGRTIYFRRMSMVLSSLLRRDMSDSGTPRRMMVVADMVSRLNGLQTNIFEYNRDQNNKSTSRKRRLNDEEEKWDLLSLRKASSTSTSPSLSQLMIKDFGALIQFWTSKIPEILSRIQHASKSLFIEVGRGFFLPFCTVAVSALARIRSLLMDIGIRGLTCIRALSDEALQIFPNTESHSLKIIVTDTDYERYMNLFLENDNNESNRKRTSLVQSTTTQDVMVDRKAILRSLGLMESTKGGPKAGGRPKQWDSNIDTDGKEINSKQDTESSSANDFYTLSSSASLQQHSGNSAASDVGTDAEMDDGERLDHDSMPSATHDSLDHNMALVNRFQKRKTAEKQSKKKVKKSKKVEDDSQSEAKQEESERKSKKRKSKKKESSKQKKKKKGKNDFFDQIFD